MKDGKLIYSLHIHVDLFTVRFHPTRPSCKGLRQVAKFEPKVSNLCSLELAHRIYYQHYSVDRIFVIVMNIHDTEAYSRNYRSTGYYYTST